jgi:hypothetical protein
MDIQTSVRLTADEADELAPLLGVAADDLPEKLADLGRAALREYVEMLLGQSVVRGTDTREQRLLLVILEANRGTVPSEAEVSQLFNITTLSARSLIRSVLSRYRRRLDPAVRLAAVQILAACEPEDEGARRVAINNPIIVEYLNELLAKLNGSLKRIGREGRTGTIYLIPVDSFAALDRALRP